MMWEAGLDGGLKGGRAEYRVGQVSKALYRDVRYLCAIGMHTQGMKVEECERMFLDEAFQDPGGARQQAARGTYDPGYLNYTQLMCKLRDDWTAKLPGPTSWTSARSRGGLRTAWRLGLPRHDRFLWANFGGTLLPLMGT